VEVESEQPTNIHVRQHSFNELLFYSFYKNAFCGMAKCDRAMTLGFKGLSRPTCKRKRFHQLVGL